MLFTRLISNLNVRRILNKIHRNYTQNVNKEVIYTRLENADEGIAVIGLNRQKQRNALSVGLVEDLREALEDAAVDRSVRVLLLRSLVPNVFCAGSIYKFYGLKRKR